MGNSIGCFKPASFKPPQEDERPTGRFNKNPATGEIKEERSPSQEDLPISSRKKTNSESLLVGRRALNPAEKADLLNRAKEARKSKETRVKPYLGPR